MIEARLDRICIVMMSAVGDAVHVLPVVNAFQICAVTPVLEFT